MLKTKPSIIFFGNEQLCTGANSLHAPIFQSLLENGYDIQALILNAGEKSKITSIEKYAVGASVPVYKVQNKQEIATVIQGLNPKLGILAAFGRIVPQTIIDSFEYGIINIHPSLLPKYRGPTPVESAILNGEKQTGVSIMKLAAEMDAGPIYSQKVININAMITSVELAAQLAQLGSELLIDVLGKLNDKSFVPIPQESTHATYCKLIEKGDGRMLPMTSTAIQLEREVRAFLGWPKSQLQYKGLDLIILESKVAQIDVKPGQLEVHNGKLLLGCKQDSLDIIRLQMAGKKPTDAKGFINGYKNILQ